MRERGLVVADPLHDREFALVVQLLHPAHRLVPAEVRVDLQHVLLVDADGRTMLVVGGVAIRHDRVEAVVAAEPLEDDQDTVRIGRRRQFGGFAEDVGHGAEAAEQAKPEAAGADPNQIAARDATVAQSAVGGHGPSGGPPEPGAPAPRIAPFAGNGTKNRRERSWFCATTTEPSGTAFT